MPFFGERANLADCARELPLRSYAPVLTLEGLLPGVDNVRHDVWLSARFVRVTRAYLAQLITDYSGIKDLLTDQSSPWRPPSVIVRGNVREKARTGEAGEFREVLLDLHTEALNRAKADGNASLELLCRLAVVKLLRAEMTAQFAAALERCRARLRSFEGPRQTHTPKELQTRERIARFQLAKKSILRRVGLELFVSFRELEKTALVRMRRSLFGESAETADLFVNLLLFTEEGRDEFLYAEHYVMLGNRDADADRFQRVEQIVMSFLNALGYPAADLDAILNEPENAHVLLGGNGGELPETAVRMQKAVLNAWVQRLEAEGILEYVIAAYEAAPLLSEYAPPLYPQQIKNALISRQERKRVKALLEEQGKLSSDNFDSAVCRVMACRGAERAKVAARLLRDYMRYHRDLRRLEAIDAALDSVNLITGEKLRELSSVNRTLYEFLLKEEQKPAEERVVHHIILKADIRDSTRLIRSLYERGLNPASYFSLNFYGPIDKLLPKYGAQKLFIEGDAIILALFENEGAAQFGVARACVLAKEILEIVRAYNEQSRKSGLPVLELGIGIAYQDSAPMYLMDGSTRIMISPALNASDRLSSCSRSARRLCADVESVFNVFTFQTVDDDDTAGQPDEFLIRYNIGGAVLDEAGFAKLRQEISLTAREVMLPTLWNEGSVQLYCGVVPVAPGIFHQLIVREARIPHIDAREFQLKHWTERRYYEVCTNPAVYELVQGLASAAGA
ncbi:MAG: hypothetical protein ACE14L_04035 [Terriglobales bacterium]